MKTADLPDILFAQDIADHLRVHIDTVYLWLKKGIIPSFKAGHARRVRKEVYLEWIEKGEGQDDFSRSKS